MILINDINNEKSSNTQKTVTDLEKRLFYDEKMMEVFSSAPTYTPKTFREQFVLYKNGATLRLYVYVTGTGWSYVALT